MSAITGIMGPVQRESTRERVCTALRDAIYSGKLKLGQRLTELELTRELQVSRPVVREALQQLAHEGMIQLNSYRGAQVIDLTTEQIDEIVHLRLLLEAEAVRLAKARMSTGDKAELRKSAAQVEAARGRIEEFVPLDLAFHRTLWRLSSNETLYRHLVLMTAPIFAMGIVTRNSRLLAGDASTRRVPGDHRTLANVICEGSEADAVEAIRNHIRENWSRTREAVGKLHSSGARRSRTADRDGEA
jgi:DNA-binding GntR family transcriptional regulator